MAFASITIVQSYQKRPRSGHGRSPIQYISAYHEARRAPVIGCRVRRASHATSRFMVGHARPTISFTIAKGLTPIFKCMLPRTKSGAPLAHTPAFTDGFGRARKSPKPKLGPRALRPAVNPFKRLFNRVWLRIDQTSASVARGTCLKLAYMSPAKPITTHFRRSSHAGPWWSHELASYRPM